MAQRIFVLIFLVIVSNVCLAQVPGKKKLQTNPRGNENPIPRAPVQKMRDTIKKKEPVQETQPQNNPNEPKVISRKENPDGSTTFEVEEIIDGRKKIVTYKLQKTLNKNFRADTLNLDSISLQVVKSRNRLYVYHGKHFLTAYKCVFGPNYKEQKKCEGDKATPEGQFHIAEIRPHKEWTSFFLLDYPTEESKRIFEENLRTGKVNKNARIGGAIGIHGVWAEGDLAVDQKMNWTDGCIALKTNDLLELGRIIKVGTPIFIKMK